VIASLRAAGGTLADLACVRMSLAAVEFAEEVERRKQQLVLGALGLAFAYSALLVATFFIAALMWDTHRLATLAALALGHVACAAGAFTILRLRARAAPAPFAATRREIAQDLELWRRPR
jgi:uncharacterized membrane protein YqjE